MRKAGYKKADYTQEKLKTITTLEKELGKPLFNELAGTFIVKPEGSPTLAPESDKRGAIQMEKQLLNEFDKEN